MGEPFSQLSDPELEGHIERVCQTVSAKKYTLVCIDHLGKGKALGR